MVFEDRLIVVEDGQFGDIFGLENVVGAGMVHVVSSARKEGDEDVEAVEGARLLDALNFYHLGKVLDDVGRVHLGVVGIISVGLHQAEGQVFDSYLVHSLAFGEVFPVELVVAVHELEVEDILVDAFVDQVRVVVVLQEVFVVRFQLRAVGSGHGPHAAIEGQLPEFLHRHALHGVLVALPEIGVDGFGKPPVDFGLALFVGRLAFLARVGNAVRNLQVVVLDHKGAPREVVIRLVHDDSLAELSSDCV